MVLTALLLVAACGDDSGVHAGDASADGDVVALGECTDDADCDDGRFCNGVERCMVGAPDADARGCLASPVARCAEDERCDEAADECRGRCHDNPDADGDGHDDIACAGDDCDDGDASVHPGAAETCDADGKDEDCNPSTFGGDEDGDGFSPVGCCNAQPDDTLLCGTDCDDTSAVINEAATEACNATDDDCDGAVDEGDGGGALTRACSTACGTGVESCTDGSFGDCTAPPVSSESCNGVDDDCDGSVDEGVLSTFYCDRDSDGYTPSGLTTTEACSAPASGTLGCSGTWRPSPSSSADCNDSDATVHPGRTETCDGRDENCDGLRDNGRPSGYTGTVTQDTACYRRQPLPSGWTDWANETTQFLDGDRDYDGHGPRMYAAWVFSRTSSTSIRWFYNVIGVETTSDWTTIRRMRTAQITSTVGSIAELLGPDVGGVPVDPHCTGGYSVWGLTWQHMYTDTDHGADTGLVTFSNGVRTRYNCYGDTAGRDGSDGTLCQFAPYNTGHLWVRISPP